MNIFNYLDYKIFIKKHRQRNQNWYGYKTQLAEAAGCQNSFLSQVLNGDNHFTPEHALGASRFFQFNPLETNYFVECVNFSRAGTKELRKFTRAKMDQLKAESENLTERYQKKKIEEPQKAATYYATWHLSAIHILLTIPEFQVVEKICERLHISKEFTLECLMELEKMGLVQKQGPKWKVLQYTIHVPKASEFVVLNHHNWRQRAMANAYRRKEEDIHYTSVCTLSREDFEHHRQLVLQLIDRSHEVIETTKPQELFGFTVDLFRV